MADFFFWGGGRGVRGALFLCIAVGMRRRGRCINTSRAKRDKTQVGEPHEINKMSAAQK